MCVLADENTMTHPISRQHGPRLVTDLIREV